MPRKEYDYQAFGKFLHKILELYYTSILEKEKGSTSALMSKAYKLALSEYKDKLSKELKQEAYSIIENFLKENSLDIKKHPNIIALEKNFSLKINEDIIVTGMIDKIQRDNDGIIHILDYKTSKSIQYVENDFFQLLTYAYAVYEDDKSIEKIRCSYVFLRHNFKYSTKEFTINEILPIKNKFIEYAKNIIKEQTWDPNTTKLCAYCDYLNLCDEGRKFVEQEAGYLLKQSNFFFGEKEW